MFAEAAGAEFAGFVFEDEGTGGGELGDEVVVAEVEGVDLSADGGGGFEVVDDFEPVGGAGEGGEGGVSLGDLDGLFYNEGDDGGVLFCNSCVGKGFDE